MLPQKRWDWRRASEVWDYGSAMPRACASLTSNAQAPCGEGGDGRGLPLVFGSMSGSRAIWCGVGLRGEAARRLGLRGEAARRLGLRGGPARASGTPAPVPVLRVVSSLPLCARHVESHTFASALLAPG